MFKKGLTGKEICEKLSVSPAYVSKIKHLTTEVCP
jgi:transcriptional regulator with XRE-family HTH domain